MRSLYKIYDNQAVYFITSSIVEWIPMFTGKPYFDILVSSIQYCQKNKKLSVYAYVIMENHFHMICQSNELDKVIQSLKRHSAKRIIEQLNSDRKTWILDALKYYKKQHKKHSEHQLWQEGFHPQQLLSAKMALQKIEYLHYNPVRRGYVSAPEHWIYSSAGDFYLNRQGLIELQELIL
jgi:REP element-mobilizing transposase RayT